MDEAQFGTTPGEAMGVDAEMRVWLDGFARRHGRPLRVLHVGNIANNAYLNAKFLRAAGIDAHVLCYDYYHVMGCPEWEEADIEGDHGDDFAPDWRRVNLHGFVRPRWFVQGPLYLCERYLRASNGGHRIRANVYWRLLDRLPRSRPFYRAVKVLRLLPRTPFGRLSDADAALVRDALGRVLRHPLVASLPGIARLHARARRRWPGPANAQPGACGAGGATSVQAAASPQPASDDRIGSLVKTFRERFPDRSDVLTRSDVIAYRIDLDVFRRIFAQYDLVQCYSTDPVHALLAGTGPYVAFEHGTLRDFTLGDERLHRLTAFAYREAAHTFITNGDCLEYARKLGITRYSAMIHPIDVEQHERDRSAESQQIRRELEAEVLLLCPLRHDWKVKGTDVHLRALPLIRELIPGRVVLVLLAWGAQIDESRALIRELGCEQMVCWLRPLPRPALIRYTKAADVLLDQMALPHFGATAPQALAAGTPVVMSYRPESTAWIVDEPAPILAAFTPDDVAQSIQRALDPAWRLDFRKRAAEWVHRYHHRRRIVHDHCDVYRRILGDADVRR